MDGIGLVEFVVESQALDHILDDASAVLGIVDGEVGGVIDALTFYAQDAGKNTQSALSYL